VWDSQNLKIPNSPEAEAFLNYTYRDGWSQAPDAGRNQVAA
jgi:hypothetical protein